jgi:alpha-glucosidase
MMTHAQPNQFQPIFNRPMSQSMRANQLGMYVVYESPLQMLADSPSESMRDRETIACLDAVPTTWDETRPLDAKVSRYVVMPRRHGDQWYDGATGDGSARELTVDRSFLADRDCTMDAGEDGPNTARNGMDVLHVTRPVTRGERLTIRLAPGGGYAARIR